MADPIADLITAVRALGPDVRDADVLLRQDGTAIVHVSTHTAAGAVSLGSQLGCGDPESIGYDGREWTSCRRGGWCDRVRLIVSSVHRQIAPAAATEAVS